MPRIFLLLSFIVIFITGCKEGEGIAEEVERIPVQLRVLRFDRAFARAEPEDIPGLKQTYPYLFPPRYPDSIWAAKMRDTLQRELLTATDSVFGDFGEETEALEKLFKHIKYYFPSRPLPTVVTLTSDVDYRNRVILTDTLLLLGLDNYLGKDHRFYRGIEQYLAEGLERKYLTGDVAAAFAQQFVRFPEDRSFLAQMVYHGKILYLKDKLLPSSADALKMGYTEEELNWARENEEQIWRYFIEGELLYSTDAKLAPRFLDPAPFSKFRLELDNESPGRLGRYIGWQLLRSFMENNNVSLQEMLPLAAEEIFKRSRYKPKK